MAIKGYQGTSLLDFPGRLASLIFFDGCNLLCPYCHNPALVVQSDQLPDYPLAALLEDLQGRLGFIDGVVISGGEPTLAPELTDLLREVKAMGLLVKLDTNGLRPDLIAPLLEQNLLDYVAIDLKSAPGRYAEIGGPIDARKPLVETLSRLQLSEVEVEVRTTCAPGLVGLSDIAAIGDLVVGMPLWALQQFQPVSTLDEAWQNLQPLPKSTLQDYARRASDYVDKVVLRGL